MLNYDDWVLGFTDCSLCSLSFVHSPLQIGACTHDRGHEGLCAIAAVLGFCQFRSHYGRYLPSAVCVSSRVL